MDKRLQDRVAIVIGAGSGIGRGVALRLSREGASVVVADINLDSVSTIAREIAGAGGRSQPVRVDVSKPVDTKELVTRVAREMGRLDIFVNTAGVVQTKLLLDVTEVDWDRVININLKGTAFAIQAAAAQMVKQVPEAVRKAGRSDRSYGKIVCFSSISGRRGREYQYAYAASKAAVISITQSAALAFAPYGINVNAISPSVVVTPMWEQNNLEKSRPSGLMPARQARSSLAEFRSSGRERSRKWQLQLRFSARQSPTISPARL